MRDAEAVGERLQPLGLVDRVAAPGRGLDMNDPLDVMEARLRDEVVRPVAQRLDRAVIVEHDVLALGLEPVVAQRRMLHVVKVNVAIGERKPRHVPPSPSVPRAARHSPTPGMTFRRDPPSTSSATPVR